MTNYADIFRSEFGAETMFPDQNDTQVSKRPDSKRTPEAKRQTQALRITRRQYASNGGRF